MRAAFKNFAAGFIIVLQLMASFSFAEAHCEPSFQAEVVSLQSFEGATLFATEDFNHSTDSKQTPFERHHCKNHSVGSCCAYLNSNGISIVPLLTKQQYRLSSNFFFFELISSNLRPPSLVV